MKTNELKRLERETKFWANVVKGILWTISTVSMTVWMMTLGM